MTPEYWGRPRRRRGTRPKPKPKPFGEKPLTERKPVGFTFEARGRVTSILLQTVRERTTVGKLSFMEETRPLHGSRVRIWNFELSPESYERGALPVEKLLEKLDQQAALARVHVLEIRETPHFFSIQPLLVHALTQQGYRRIKIEDMGDEPEIVAYRKETHTIEH